MSFVNTRRDDFCVLAAMGDVWLNTWRDVLSVLTSMGWFSQGMLRCLGGVRSTVVEMYLCVLASLGCLKC